MAASYTIQDSVRDDVAHIDVVGDLDLSAKAALEDHVTRHVSTGAVTGVVIDLSAVTFIDSTGIGALVVCRHTAADAGKTLTVSGAQGRVAAMMDLTGVRAWLAGEPEPGSTPG